MKNVNNLKYQNKQNFLNINFYKKPVEEGDIVNKKLIIIFSYLLSDFLSCLDRTSPLLFAAIFLIFQENIESKKGL